MLETPADQAWMFEAPAAAAPAQPSLLDDDHGPAKIEPLAAETHSFSHPEAIEEEPLFPSIHPEERRQQKSGGWLSLFGGGRPRYEAAPPVAHETPRERPAAAPIPQARTVASAQLAEEPKSDEGEDLNIPSFLRRLAN